MDAASLCAMLFVWPTLASTSISNGLTTAPAAGTAKKPSLLMDISAPVVGTAKKPSLVVDILSVGSTLRPGLAIQKHTWAAHPSIRYFHGASEVDGSYCGPSAGNHTPRICRKHLPGDSWLMRRWRHSFASKKWAARKGGPDWFCAQRRWLESFGKACRFYRQKANHRRAALPDYLLVVDDDTYYDIDRFMLAVGHLDTSQPLAFTGCLILSPSVHIPWGGYGLALSKGLLSRLIHPLVCSGPTTGDTTGFERRACDVVRANLVNELEHYHDGMSLSDLALSMGVSRNELCLHSDWASGYLVNASMAGDGRLQSLWGVQPTKPGAEGNCSRTTGTSINMSSFIRHLANVTDMEKISQQT